MPIRFSGRWRHIALGLAAAALAHGTQADDGTRAARVPLLPQYQQECAACHVAYPPGMLPAASWQRLIDNLPRHFGTDASLDAATVKNLSTWLAAHAGTGKRAPRSAARRPHHALGMVHPRTRRGARGHLEAAGGEERRQLRGLSYPSRPRSLQ